MNHAKFLKLLYVQVIIGLVLGITVGHYWPELGAALKPLGDGFVKLVKMMIAPIVFCTIVSGITALGDSKEIGKTLLKSMGLFYALTILALVTGLVVVSLMQPGAGMHIDPKQLDPAVAALTSTISNAVACIVVSIWEKACDRDVLQRELSVGYAKTEQALEDGEAEPAGIGRAPAAPVQAARLH